MQKAFETTLIRRSHRERFYSSMNYDEFCQIYGPPSPLVKPQQDPIEDLPLFDLEQQPSIDTPQQLDQLTSLTLGPLIKMDTIFEIEGSENFTQNLQRSPELQPMISWRKEKQDGLGIGAEVSPKRMRVRMRSQSDNSEYLIFNFLERMHERYIFGYKEEERKQNQMNDETV